MPDGDPTSTTHCVSPQKGQRAAARGQRLAAVPAESAAGETRACAAAPVAGRRTSATRPCGAARRRCRRAGRSAPATLDQRRAGPGADRSADLPLADSASGRRRPRARACTMSSITGGICGLLLARRHDELAAPQPIEIRRAPACRTAARPSASGTSSRPANTDPTRRPRGPRTARAPCTGGLPMTVVPWAAISRNRDVPKSPTLSRPLSVTKTLAGRRSRWMTPCLCACSTAFAIWQV